jgi:hypothetical protein
VLDEEDDPVKPNARSWGLLERFRRLGVEERVHPCSTWACSLVRMGKCV